MEELIPNNSIVSEKPADKSISLKYVLLLATCFIFLFAFLFKLNEYNTLKTINEQYNKNWSEELALTSTLNQQNNDATNALTDISSASAQITPDELSGMFDTAISKVSVYKNNQEDYIQNLRLNKQMYQSLRSRTSFMFGYNKAFVNNLINNQADYYDIEIDGNSRTLVSNDLLISLFDVLKDGNALSKFAKETGTNIQVTYPQYFSDIASLEKYTEDGFKFTNEDNIRKYNPYGYDVLMRFKSYYKSYYAVVKDVVNGDMESAQYKYTTLQSDSNNLNVDWDRISNENNDQQIKTAKKEMDIVIGNISLVRDFEKNKSVKYPFVKGVGDWNDQLIQCQLYDFKASLYSLLNEKLPTAKNMQDFLNQLSTISPKTTQIDSSFDKTVMDYSSTDKAITVTCKDKYSGKSLKFVSLK